jgi:hypothetical protein
MTLGHRMKKLLKPAVPFSWPVISISRREWVTAVILAVIVATMMVLPYLLGHWSAPPDTIFTGLLINVEDGSYLSAIEQGRQGAWVYRNFFTAEPHQPVFIQGFYLGVGQLARVLGISAVAGWHLALWLADFFLFLVLFWFIGGFLERPDLRLTAFLLAIFGSGFDWFQFPLAFERANTLEAVPLDIFVPEAHIFFSVLTYPHFAMGIAAILLVFGCLLRSWFAQNQIAGWLLALLAGLANVLLAVVYPFLIFLVGPVLGVYYLLLLWQAQRILWREGLMLVLAFALPIPLFLYYGWAIRTVEVFRLWNDQAVTLTPNPLHLLLAYLPYLVLGFLVWRGWRARPLAQRWSLAFLWVWLGTVAVLLYLPLNPQRRFVEGLQVPLSMLAALGLLEVAIPWLLARPFFVRLAQRPRYSTAGIQKLVVAMVLLAVSLINLYIYLGTVATLALIRPYPLFRPLAEVEGMQWLQEHTEPGAVILSRYWSGSYIPSQAMRPVFVGQRYESVQFEAKRTLADVFFAAGHDDRWRRDWLAEHHIAYLFVGPHERELAGWPAASPPFLQSVYQNTAVTIYQVNFSE